MSDIIQDQEDSRLLHKIQKTREQIMDWWEARQTREDGTTRAASSLAQDASHLRAFYRWAMQQDKAERNAAS